MVLARRRQGKAATIPDHPICHHSWWPCPSCPSFAKRLACRHRHLGAPSRCNSSIRLEAGDSEQSHAPRRIWRIWYVSLCFTVFTVWLSSFRRFFMSSRLQEAAHVDMSLSPNLVLIFKINSLSVMMCREPTVKHRKGHKMDCHGLPLTWPVSAENEVENQWISMHDEALAKTAFKTSLVHMFCHQL